MFFKGIAIFFIIYRSIETELIKSKRATHFDFWVTPHQICSAFLFLKAFSLFYKLVYGKI